MMAFSNTHLHVHYIFNVRNRPHSPKDIVTRLLNRKVRKGCPSSTCLESPPEPYLYLHAGLNSLESYHTGKQEC